MAKTEKATTPPHVVIIHLDLGIGGAESLVLNLAKATLPADHDVYTTDNEGEFLPCLGHI